MEKEGMSREFAYKDQAKFDDGHLADSMAEEFLEVGGEKVNPLSVDLTPREYAIERKEYGMVRDSGLYDEAEVANLLERHTELFKKLGFTGAVSVLNSSVKGYDGGLFVTKLNAVDKNGQGVSGWLVADAEKNNSNSESEEISFSGNIIYTVHLPGIEQKLEVVKPDAGFELGWLRDYSEIIKVVKSRPAWMYPELFELPTQEVWPKNANVAVIGDPFQACDKEGVTMIEYEYADEMVPPVLQLWLEGKTELQKPIENWLDSLYRENIGALNRLYGSFAPSKQNPYIAYFKYCEFLVTMVAEEMVTGQVTDPQLAENIEKARILGEKLRKGNWEKEEGKELVLAVDEIFYQKYYSEKDPIDTTEGLDDWYEYKEESLKSLGDPESWTEYLKRWNLYLEKIPTQRLKDLIPDWDRKLNQAKYWLEIIPKAKSPERCAAGRNYLDDFFNEIASYRDESVPEMANLFDPDIAFIESKGIMSDNVLGFFQPGYPLNRRNRETLLEGIGRVDQMQKYATYIFPKLQAEKKRIEELNAPMSVEMQKKYLEQLEKALAEQAFFYKRTQKAIPVHGFFPHNMPEIDQQDRILALTSVTMHGWNHMDYEGFKKDLVPALNYLKIGGKYILGPINQQVYFGGGYSDFKCRDLTHVLKELKESGIIEYEFKKGTRNHAGEFDEYEDDAKDWSKDSQDLLPDESAHSLVITRLK
ncbi:MAG: hypothetical protein KAZ30_03135 [Candidatus Magasanikbacteria bacterium]|nr:hypothetical protein [Candidatus Magasanikbacteria bacterium]